jgi:hypothetical protein
VFTDTKKFFEERQRQYDKQLTYQVKQRVLRLDPTKDEYRVTLKWALRMQRNMFNPFSDNFTLLKLAAAVAVGTLPVVVSLGHAQILRWLEPIASVQADIGLVSMLMLAYAIAGVAAGLIFRHKSFIWAFLLAYIPTLLMPSTNSHALGMSLVMGWVADLTFRIQGRRKRLV